MCAVVYHTRLFTLLKSTFYSIPSIVSYDPIPIKNVTLLPARATGCNSNEFIPSETLSPNKYLSFARLFFKMFQINWRTFSSVRTSSEKCAKCVGFPECVGCARSNCGVCYFDLFWPTSTWSYFGIFHNKIRKHPHFSLISYFQNLLPNISMKRCNLANDSVREVCITVFSQGTTIKYA